MTETITPDQLSALIESQHNASARPVPTMSITFNHPRAPLGELIAFAARTTLTAGTPYERWAELQLALWYGFASRSGAAERDAACARALGPEPARPEPKAKATKAPKALARSDPRRERRNELARLYYQRRCAKAASEGKP